MPRTARASRGGTCFHVLNRGNSLAEVFHSPEDYDSFVKLMGEANARLPMRVTGYCLMPSHFHLLLWPRKDGDLSRWMQWLMTSHVRRYHRIYRSSGHVWQGRFKSFPIQADDHYRTVLRYVERNPLRAKLVTKSQAWKWSSLSPRPAASRIGLLSDGPLLKPTDWTAIVNRPESEAELESLRRSVIRGTPYGDSKWQKRTASRLGLDSTMRPRGRPVKEK